MQFNLNLVETEEEIKPLAEMASEIWNECYSSIITKEQIDYMLHNFQSVQAIRKQIQEERYEYYFITAQGERIGYLAIREDADKLFLSKFYLLDVHRGKGYAKKAMDRLKQICKDRNLQAIWLTVNRHNERAIAAYKKNGFRPVRTQVADIGNGFVMDDYVMEWNTNLTSG